LKIRCGELVTLAQLKHDVSREEKVRHWRYDVSQDNRVRKGMRAGQRF
jgi:hypothetical protein